jgi:ribosomal protein S27AE
MSYPTDELDIQDDQDSEDHTCPHCGGVLLAEPFHDDETPNAQAQAPAAASCGRSPGATGSA